VLVGWRPFLVVAERGGDPQADPALAGQLDELVELGPVLLGLGAVDDATGVEGESQHGGPLAHRMLTDCPGRGRTEGTGAVSGPA
jgi:hypothetical protein